MINVTLISGGGNGEERINSRVIRKIARMSLGYSLDRTGYRKTNGSVGTWVSRSGVCIEDDCVKKYSGYR